MPPKKKGGSAIDPDDPSMNPEAVVDNYKKYCKLAALPPHPKVLAQLGGDEEQLEVMMKNEQLVVDGEADPGAPRDARVVYGVDGQRAGHVRGRLQDVPRTFLC